MNTRTAFAAALLALSSSSCDRNPDMVNAHSPRTVTVAQTGQADVIGNDSAALAKAVALLHAGDTLSIGPGTYEMQDSLRVPSGVTVRGAGAETILKKSRGVESPLVEDGDYGESNLRVADGTKFHPGMGISVVDDAQTSGWDVSVSSVAEVNGNLLRIHPMTLRDYDFEEKHAKVRNTFPILCAIEAKDVVFENLVVDGNKAENAYIDGCRGGAIYVYDARNVTIRKCVARNFNGDGISFQITDGVQVLDSESYGHTGYGVHPGTGSPNAKVTGCHIHNNGQVGLFLCWRVRNGEFSNNVIEDNGRYGISIGHKDTDNLFANNKIVRNGFSGVYFRKESMANSGHRNTFRNNTITGNAEYGFYIEPHAGDLVLENNRIATQRYSVYKAQGAGSVQLKSNTTDGKVENGGL